MAASLTIVQSVSIEEHLSVKFNSCLLMVFHLEVDLFQNASLNKAFLWALAVECKVDP